MLQRAFALLGILPALALAAPSHPDAMHPKPVPTLNDAQFKAALDQIDRKIPELMAAMHVPGLEITVVKGDKVVLLKGYGYRNVEKKLPMTPDTEVMIASCSKAFNSTLALMAVQDGKLSLTDPVRQYLPYFKLKDPDADAHMTVGNLMDHSSGLPRTDGAWPLGQMSGEECVRLLADCEPTYLFRENAQYSNILVGAAGMVSEKVYGEPWSQLLKEKITGPLHMDSTTVDPPEKIDPARMATGYWFDPLTNSVEPDQYLDAPGIMAAGAVKSTARDLSNWLRFHLGGGTFEGRSLLDPKLLSQAYANRQPVGDYIGFGMGWMTTDLYGDTVIQHGGDLPGFQSIVCFVPDRHFGFAFTTTNDEAGMRGPLFNLFMEKLVGKVDKKWVTQVENQDGLYIDPAGSHLLRIYDEASLWAVLDQGKPVRLTRTGWGAYRTTDPRNPQCVIRFEPQAHSSDLELHLSLSGTDTIYRKKVDLHPGTTVDALMDKWVQAMGGRDSVSKPLNLLARYEARQAQEGLDVDGLLARSSDGYGSLERLLVGGRYIGSSLTGANGEGGGSTATHFRLSPFVGELLADAQIDAQLCQGLNWRKTFRSAEIVAKTSLNGEPVFVVRMKPLESSNEVLNFLSENTGLLVRREVGSPANVTVYDDYRPFEGVMLPWKLTTIDGGLHREDMRITSYEKANHYPHWAFAPKGTNGAP